MSTTLSAGTATTGAALASDTSGVLQFQSGSTPTTAVTIDTAQNVGVGVTPPTFNTGKSLSVYDAGSSLWSNANGSMGIVTNAYYNSGWKYQATGAAARMDVGNANGTTTWGYAASGSAGSAITWTTGMTLDNSGNLLVGVTSGSWHNLIKASSGGYVLNVFNTNAASGDGGMQVRAGTNNTSTYVLNCGYQGPSPTDTFRVYGNGTYGTISDINRKKNIETTRDGYLTDLNKLRVVKYNWKTQENGEAKELGFIAQEIEQVFPALVETDKDDLKMIKQPVLIPMLVKAIQELSAQVTALQAEVTALKGAK